MVFSDEKNQKTFDFLQLPLRRRHWDLAKERVVLAIFEGPLLLLDICFDGTVVISVVVEHLNALKLLSWVDRIINRTVVSKVLIKA